MKLLPLIFLLLCAPAFASTLPTNFISGGVTLSWNYPTNEVTDDLQFNLYGTTNILTPWEQWGFVTNVSATNFAPYQVVFDGTNWLATNFSARVNLPPAQYFFVATATNFWGETSITSNLVVTPPAPLPINDSLRIRKAP